MKISVERAALIPALSVVGGVVERRQTLPILGNLLIDAEGDQIRLKGTDLEIEISSVVNAKIHEPGSTTLPARKLIDIVRSLPDQGVVELRTEGDRASLVCERSRFVLSTLSATDFPAMESPAAEICLTLDRDVLRRLLEKTSFAMAHQDVRYYLNGVLLEFGPQRMTAVATDGHRLSKVNGQVYKVETTPDFESRQVIIPAKTVTELKRLLSTASEDVRLGVSERTLRVDLANTVVVSKLVEGQYPDYNRVIPAGLERRATIDREGLRAALQRTAILSNEKYKGVRVTFDEGRLLLETNNPEKELAEDELEIEYSGEKVSVGFNVAYVLDVLSAVDAPLVDVEFGNAESSAVWHGKGSADEVFVIMPMRL